MEGGEGRSKRPELELVRELDGLSMAIRQQESKSEVFSWHRHYSVELI